MLTTIPAQTGTGVRLRAGQRLRVVDPQGGQVCDLMAYSHDGRDRLNNGRTFDYNGKILLSTGDALWSDASRKLLTIVADDVGRHDFLYAACSVEMFRIQYGVEGHHPNCTENMTEALRALGIEPGPLPTPFNAFQHVVIEGGALVIHAPRSKPGDAITFRAEMDVAVALSACSAAVCNGGTCKPIAFEILGPERSPSSPRRDPDADPAGP